jgi:hypothetical protein
MAIPIDLSKLTGKVEAQIQVGGGLPCRWDLYDYAPAGDGFERRLVASGNGMSWSALGKSAGELGGHTVLWSVAVVNFDTSVREVSISMVFRGGGGEARVEDKWKADPANPRFYASVKVGP